MTENKFWLVWSPQGITPPKKQYNSQELAIKAGKKLAESYPKQDFYAAPVTHHFKADVNVVETVLSEQVSKPTTNNELETPTDNEPEFKFKIGDIVYARCVYKKKQIKAKIRSFLNEKYCFLNVLSDDPIDTDNNAYPFFVNYLTHA